VAYPTDKRSKLPRLEKADGLSSAKVGNDATGSKTPTAANLFIKVLLLILFSIINIFKINAVGFHPTFYSMNIGCIMA
jgi:hypothetical protein